MRKIIHFSKFFVPAAVISAVLAVLGVTGYIYNKGFNLGVDFQAGLIQEVQLAPAAFNITWNGTSNAVISHGGGNIYIIVSGSGVESRTYTFPLSFYSSIGSLAQAMTQQIEGIEVSVTAAGGTNTQWLKFSTYGTPELGSETPYVVHYLSPGADIISISDIRTAMAGFGQTVSVQSMGQPEDRQFMIRVQDREEGNMRPEEVKRSLETHFGKDSVVVLRSDYVGSRFIKTDQLALLVALTLLLILIYSAFRFRFRYAVSLVTGIMYDALVIIGFVAWTRMEFTTSTIAAILTIIGYSTNNTIVVFDRIRETRRMYPDDTFLNVLNRSLTETLNRTIITTVSTLIAVVCLFVFTTGSMKDFALALIIGMLSGVYTTTFIASGIVNFWERKSLEREKKKLAASSSS
jgi:preprotein translocase subunit SecF